MRSRNHHDRHPPLAMTSLAIAASLAAGGASAEQTNNSASGAESLDKVVVSATRTEQSVSDVARSVTVIDREQIEEQAKHSETLGDILGKTVPGLGPGTSSQSNFGQTLRGQRLFVLIDGIPQTSALRNARRGLNSIAPASIERIEVIRGGTAKYGFGATGGLINVITKEAATEPFAAYSQIGTRFSTDDVNDSLSLETQHRISGTQDQFDYVVSGSIERRGARFDADGDRIPPNGAAGGQGGIQETSEYSILGKGGFDFDGGNQRLELMVTHFENKQDQDYTVGSTLEDGKTPAIPVAEAPEKARPVIDPATESTNARISYSNDDLLGSEVSAQTYYGERSAAFPRFPPLTLGSFTQTFPQSENESEKHGLRTTVVTPLDQLVTGSSVTWGIDYVSEEAEQTRFEFGRDNFSNTPDLEQESGAAFAEFELPIGQFMRLRAGLRHERTDLDVSSLETNRSGNEIKGGTLEFEETLFNAGAVFYATDRVDIFANFSQGFSLGDIGRTIADARGQSVFEAESFESDVKTVDNFELGTRFFGDDVNAEFVVFYSESENGSTFNDNLEIVKSDEEIWGVEGSADYAITERYRLGGTFTWADGQRLETETPESGDKIRLDGTRIAPVKVTSYIEQQATSWWSNRLQGMYVGHRDKFRDAAGPENFLGRGQGTVNSYFLVDATSKFQLGRGEFNVSIQNLFDEDYKPAINQAQNSPTSQIAGEGRTYFLSYSFDW